MEVYVVHTWGMKIYGFPPCVKICTHLIALSNSNMCNIVTLLRILARVNVKTVIYRILDFLLNANLLNDISLSSSFCHSSFRVFESDCFAPDPGLDPSQFFNGLTCTVGHMLNPKITCSVGGMLLLNLDKTEK